MALNSSGPISIGGSTAGQSINLELGRTSTTSSNLDESQLRTLAGVPSGAISFSSFYGKANELFTDYALYSSNKTTNQCKKFGYLNFTITPTTSLTTGVINRQGTGNSSLGLITGGGPYLSEISTTEKFLYSNNTVVAGGNLNIQRTSGNGFSNSTRGILACGQVGSDLTGNYTTGEVSSVYTWSNNACTAGATLGFGGVNLGYACSGGNSATGIIRNTDGATRVYTHATDTVVTGTAVSGGVNGGSATSTPTIVYIRPNGGNSVYKYNISSNAVATVSTGIYTCTNAGAAGNGTIAHFDNGTSASNPIVYTYSSDSYAASANYSMDMSRPVALSNPPGGF